MKKSLLAQIFNFGTFAFFLSIGNAFSQNNLIVDSPEYQQRKINGTLPQSVFSPRVFNTNRPFVAANPGMAVTSTNSTNNCNCLQNLDSTFSVVPFNSGSAPFFSNDDASSAAIALPFNFCYYGEQIDTVFINNNGNISFDVPYINFSSQPFPNSSVNMIAAYWGDVDTRGSFSQLVYDSLMNVIDTIPGTSHNGAVYYKITPSALIVRWDSVGYFPTNGQLRNTFQITITDGADSLISGGNNVAFCYGDMQWSAGGPCTAGANKGDGINFFQIGRFDHPGIDYDGPGGNNDGISFLDNSAYFISTCTSNNNIPPIALTSACDSIEVAEGDTSVVEFVFVGPESNQVVTASVEISNSNYSVLSNVSGNPCVVTVQIVGSAQRASNDIVVIASDNGTPVATTQQTVSVSGAPAIVTSLNKKKMGELSISPNPSNGLFKLSFDSEGQKLISVYNSIGSLVKTEITSNSNFSMNLSDQAKGVYFVQVKSNNSIKVQKLIIE